ncbi:MAG: hypothetical protein ACPGUV_08315, partial [Polyangiales bacterium]
MSLAEVLNPNAALPADDRAIGALCALRGWTVVVREPKGWSIIGDAVSAIVFVHSNGSHFTALDINDHARAEVMVKQWPRKADFDSLVLRPVVTPGDRQMCFWYAAARGAATWRGDPPPTG